MRKQNVKVLQTIGDQARAGETDSNRSDKLTQNTLLCTQLFIHSFIRRHHPRRHAVDDVCRKRKRVVVTDRVRGI